MSYVNKPVRKKDAMALVTGQPVYTDDLAPKDCLVVKVLRSPPCPCVDRGDQDRECHEGSGDRVYPHLRGCAPGQIYHGGTDLSGIQPL